MWYDTLLAILIIVGLLLIIAAKVTKQTIGEMMSDIMGFFRNQKEDVEDKYLEIR